MSENEPGSTMPAKDAPADRAPDAQPPRKSRAWRWWLFGFVCAIGLGIFMWAVGGQWNLNDSKPSGPAATPQEAVLKLMAAIDSHDEELAADYATPEYVESGAVDQWIDRTGYLRYIDASVVSDDGSETIMRVRYEQVTRFLDDEDPKGLNLAFAVFPEELTGLFGATRAEDGGWRVSGFMDPAKP